MSRFFDLEVLVLFLHDQIFHFFQKSSKRTVESPVIWMKLGGTVTGT